MDRLELFQDAQGSKQFVKTGDVDAFLAATPAAKRMKLYESQAGNKIAVADDDDAAFQHANKAGTDAFTRVYTVEDQGKRQHVRTQDLDAFREATGFDVIGGMTPPAPRSQGIMAKAGRTLAWPAMGPISEPEHTTPQQERKAEIRRMAEAKAQVPGPGSVAGGVLKGAGEGAVSGLADAGLALAKGVVGIPQLAVGLANIPTMGAAGKGLEAVGVDFKGTQDALSGWQSEDLRARQDEFAQAPGVGGKLAALAASPQILAGTTLESLPTMFAGGAMGGAVGAAIPRLEPIAGAIGEGLASAGQALEQVRSENPSGYLTPKQIGLLTGSGVLTGALGALGNKAAKWLKIADIDTLAAGGVAPVAKAGILRRVIGGMVSEGLIEELPQSLQEQVAQNLAQGNPWGQGVEDAGILGAFAGAVMGGAGNLSMPRKAGSALPPKAGTPKEGPQQSENPDLVAFLGMLTPEARKKLDSAPAKQREIMVNRWASGALANPQDEAGRNALAKVFVDPVAANSLLVKIQQRAMEAQAKQQQPPAITVDPVKQRSDEAVAKVAANPTAILNPENADAIVEGAVHEADAEATPDEARMREMRELVRSGLTQQQAEFVMSPDADKYRALPEYRQYLGQAGNDADAVLSMRENDVSQTPDADARLAQAAAGTEPTVVPASQTVSEKGVTQVPAQVDQQPAQQAQQEAQVQVPVVATVEAAQAVEPAKAQGVEPDYAATAAELGIRFDGVQENSPEPVQFTDTDKASPAYGATFYLPAGATAKDLSAKLAEKRAQFAAGAKKEQGALQAKATVNENGVITNPETVEIPIPKSVKAVKNRVVIWVAQGPDGKWRNGYDIAKATGNMSGSSSSPSVNGKGYDTREEAIAARKEDLAKWAEREFPEVVPYLRGTVPPVAPKSALPKKATVKPVATQGTDKEFAAAQAQWKQQLSKGEIDEKELGRRVMAWKSTEPVAPESANTEGAAYDATVAGILAKYDDGIDNMTVGDVANAVEMANDVPDSALLAVAKYRRARTEDREEFGERGDIDGDEDALLAALRKAANTKAAKSGKALPEKAVPAAASVSSVPSEGRVTYRAVATGKKSEWIKKDGEWYRQVNGAPSGKPLAPMSLRDALDRQLAKESTPAAAHASALPQKVEQKPPELMTPEEYIAQSEDVSQMRRLRAEEEGLSLSTPGDKRKAQKAVNAAIRNERGRHEQSLYDARRENKPINAAAVDAYGVTLPTGYVRDGDRYVYQKPAPQSALPPKVEQTAKEPVVPATRKFDSPARMEESIASVRKVGQIPYVEIVRDLGGGRSQYEAYDLDGKLLTTGIGVRDIGLKLNRRKGRYNNVTGANYRFAADEQFSMDALRGKMRENDTSLAKEMDEADKREKGAPATPKSALPQKAPAPDRKGRTPEQVAQLSKTAAAVREATAGGESMLPKPVAPAAVKVTTDAQGDKTVSVHGEDVFNATAQPARYANGMLAVKVPGKNGLKSRAARLAEAIGGRFSNRESAYIMSPGQFERLQKSFANGDDANPVTGKLEVKAEAVTESASVPGHRAFKDASGAVGIVDPDGNLVRGETFTGRNALEKAQARAAELDAAEVAPATTDKAEPLGVTTIENDTGEPGETVSWEYRIRKIDQAQAQKWADRMGLSPRERMKFSGNRQWIVESRRIDRDAAGKQKQNEYGEWGPSTEPQPSREKAIERLMQMGNRVEQMESTDADVVAFRRRETAISDAKNKVSEWKSRLRDIVETANAKYQDELKRRKLLKQAKDGAISDAKLKEIQAPLKAEIQGSYDAARKAVASAEKELADAEKSSISDFRQQNNTAPKQAARGESLPRVLQTGEYNERDIEQYFDETTATELPDGTGRPWSQPDVLAALDRLRTEGVGRDTGEGPAAASGLRVSDAFGMSPAFQDRDMISAMPRGLSREVFADALESETKGMPFAGENVTASVRDEDVPLWAMGEGQAARATQQFTDSMKEDYNADHIIAIFNHAGRGYSIRSAVRAGWKAALDGAARETVAQTGNAGRLEGVGISQAFAATQTFKGIHAVASQLGITAIPITQPSIGNGVARGNIIFIPEGPDAAAMAAHEIGHVLYTRGNKKVRALVSMVNADSAVFGDVRTILLSNPNTFLQYYLMARVQLGMSVAEAEAQAGKDRLEPVVQEMIANEITMGVLSGRKDLLSAYTDSVEAKNLAVSILSEMINPSDVQAAMGEGQAARGGNKEYERFFELRSDFAYRRIAAFEKSKKGETAGWDYPNFNRIKKIWNDYAKTGVVRDERGMDEIADNIVRLIAAMDFETQFAGHSSDGLGSSEALDEMGVEPWSEEKLNRYYDWTGLHISDYAMEPLQKIAVDLLAAESAEEKLQLVDRVLNTIHQASDLTAENFIKGGKSRLNELSGTGEYGDAYKYAREARYSRSRSRPGWMEWQTADGQTAYAKFSPSGVIRAMTMGNQSHFFLDRYDNASQLKEDIREEAMHRLINTLGGKRWQKIGTQVYSGMRYAQIVNEIQRNYKDENGNPLKPGSEAFNHELVAKMVRDGQQNVGFWRRVLDAIVAALRQAGRDLGLKLDVSDAELRNFANGVLRAKMGQMEMGGSVQARILQGDYNEQDVASYITATEIIPAKDRSRTGNDGRSGREREAVGRVRAELARQRGGQNQVRTQGAERFGWDEGFGSDSRLQAITEVAGRHGISVIPVNGMRVRGMAFMGDVFLRDSDAVETTGIHEIGHVLIQRRSQPILDFVAGIDVDSPVVASRVEDVLADQNWKDVYEGRARKALGPSATADEIRANVLEQCVEELAMEALEGKASAMRAFSNESRATALRAAALSEILKPGSRQDKKRGALPPKVSTTQRETTNERDWHEASRFGERDRQAGNQIPDSVVRGWERTLADIQRSGQDGGEYSEGERGEAWRPDLEAASLRGISGARQVAVRFGGDLIPTRDADISRYDMIRKVAVVRVQDINQTRMSTLHELTHLLYHAKNPAVRRLTDLVAYNSKAAKEYLGWLDRERPDILRRMVAESMTTDNPRRRLQVIIAEELAAMHMAGDVMARWAFNSQAEADALRKLILDGPMSAPTALPAKATGQAIGQAARGDAAAVTPSQDAEYLAAVERGDMETAQRMVDDAAKRAGYTVGYAHHGTADNITTFDSKERGRTTGSSSAKRGFFFAKDKTVAEGYADFARPTNIDALKRKQEQLEKQAQRSGTNEAWNKYYEAYAEYETAELSYSRDDRQSKVITTHLSLNNPLVHDYEGKDFRDETYDEIIRRAQRAKHDGVILKNTFDGVGEPGSFGNPMTDIYVVFNPSQIKSADAVTRDDSGRVIPLSQRFNHQSPDIRYARGEATPKRSALPPKAGQSINATADRLATGEYDEQDIRSHFRNLAGTEVPAGEYRRWKDADIQAAIERIRQTGNRATGEGRPPSGQLQVSDSLGDTAGFRAAERIAAQHGIVVVPVDGIPYGKPAMEVNGIIYMTEDERLPELAIHEIGHALLRRGESALTALYDATDLTTSMGQFFVNLMRSDEGYSKQMLINARQSLGDGATPEAIADHIVNQIRNELMAAYLEGGDEFTSAFKGDAIQLRKNAIAAILGVRGNGSAANPNVALPTKNTTMFAAANRATGPPSAPQKRSALPPKLTLEQRRAFNLGRRAVFEALKPVMTEARQQAAVRQAGALPRKAQVSATLNDVIANTDQKITGMKGLLDQIAKTVHMAEKNTATGIKEVQTELMKLITAVMPKEEIGAAGLKQVVNAQTFDDLIEALPWVKQQVDAWERRELRLDIKKLYNRFKDSSVIDVQYRDRIKAAMDPYVMERPSGRKWDAINRMLVDTIASMSAGEEAGASLDQLYALANMTRTPLADLSKESLITLRDQMAFLAQLGKLTLTARRAAMLDRARDDARAAIFDLLPAKDFSKIIGATSGELTADDRIQNAMRAASRYASAIDMAISPVDSTLMAMSRGRRNLMSGLMRVVKHPMAAAWGRAAGRYADFQASLVDKSKELGIKTKDQWNRIGILGISEQNTGGDPAYGRKKLYNTFQTKARMEFEQRRGVKATKSEEDVESVREIIDGYIDKAISEVTPQERQMLDWLRGQMDPLLPQVNRIMRQLQNRELTKEDFYFPLMTDWDLAEASGFADQFKRYSEEELMSGPGVFRAEGGNRKTAEPGSAKERVGVGYQPVNFNAYTVVTRHMNDVLYFIEMEPVLRHLAKVVSQPEFKEAMGPERLQFVNRLIDLASRHGGVKASQRIGWMDTMRNLLGAGQLAGSPSMTAVQLSQSIYGMAENGAGNTLAAAGELITSKAMRDFVRQMSPVVRLRMGPDQAWREAGIGKLTKGAAKVGFYLGTKLDRGTAEVNWLAAYKRALADQGIAWDAASPAKNETAANMANAVVARTSASANPLDLPPMLSGLSGNNVSLAKTAFQFQTPLFYISDFLRRDMIQGALKYPRKALALAMAMMLAALYEYSVRQTISEYVFPKDRPAKKPTGLEKAVYRKVRENLSQQDARTVAKAADGITMTALGNLPMVGNLRGIGVYQGAGFPVADWFRSGIQGAFQAGTAETEEGRKKGMMRVGEAAAAIMPGGKQVARAAQSWLPKKAE